MMHREARLAYERISGKLPVGDVVGVVVVVGVGVVSGVTVSAAGKTKPLQHLDFLECSNAKELSSSHVG